MSDEENKNPPSEPIDEMDPVSMGIPAPIISEETKEPEEVIIETTTSSETTNIEHESAITMEAQVTETPESNIPETDQNEQLLEEIKSLKQNIKILEAELASINSEKNDLESKITIIDQELNKARSENTELKSRTSNIQSDFDNTKKQLTVKDMEVNDLHDKVDSLKAEVSSLKLKKSSSVDLEREIKVLKGLLSIESSAMDLYEALKAQRTIEMRQLAMQSRMSGAQAKTILENLEKQGLVKIDRANSDDPNPRVSLND